VTDHKRLIETAFPLKQASLDSVHEKNVRHGHISTLHIWPARRPLAASRAALIATLLPDPGTVEERKRILDKIGGTLVQVTKQKKMPNGHIEEKVTEETVGGILHWGRESSPDLEWFRQEIRKAYDGQPPKVLDPFAGGGAIPLEAIRLGCETIASDINPVAWFILKCTLEYPQKLAGKHRPLPKFAIQSPDFMLGFFKGTGKLTKKQMERNLQAAQLGLFPPPDVDLSWHVRAWGWWVLQKAKADLEKFYPVVDGKPTVAYLWARTVVCKDCRATVPLLKTRWLCKRDNKRVLLTLEPDTRNQGVVFGVQADVPIAKGNAAQRREHDKRIGAGTMSRSGVTCPCCKTTMTMEYMRLEGHSGRLCADLTTVVVDGKEGKEYRLPTDEEIQMASRVERELPNVFSEIPFGLPEEPTPTKSQFSGIANYGLLKWTSLFTHKQLLSHGQFIRHFRLAKDKMSEEGYPIDWIEAIMSYLACVIGKTLDYGNQCCSWYTQNEQITHLFNRFALPIKWDYAETSSIGGASGSWDSMLNSVAKSVSTAMALPKDMPTPSILLDSAINITAKNVDVIITDPPYYGAIPYSDVMDFFYVWLRRMLHGFSTDIDRAFEDSLSPKWNHEKNDGELIDDSSRFDEDKERSKANYEDGMARAFQACHCALKPEGRFVIVFAHKQPDAWETLVSAIIRAGFVVDGSWPIQTEMGNRTRALSSAALSSSVWLVCRKRPDAARPGWDNKVLEEMRENIHTHLREFWDAGIRGPDFVWAATGPALEAYSNHPVVKKANTPGQVMTVSEFLRHVRRIVVDFVVGRVLAHNGGDAPSGLDDVTTYYLLHRNDFKLDDTPVGPCILYAVSCGLSDRDLADQYDILARTGGQTKDEDEETVEVYAEDTDDEVEEGTGSTVRLKAWNLRKRPGMGYDPAVDSPRARRAAASPSLFPEIGQPVANSRDIPLIDKVHRLMHLWKAGDVVKVDEYLDDKGLRRSVLFHQFLQALIELAPHASEERSLLESMSNHVAGRGEKVDNGQGTLYGNVNAEGGKK